MAWQGHRGCVQKGIGLEGKGSQSWVHFQIHPPSQSKPVNMGFCMKKIQVSFSEQTPTWTGPQFPSLMPRGPRTYEGFRS